MNSPEILIVADQIEMIPTEDLVATKNRIKIHTPDQVAQIAGLMVEFGWTVPILIGKDNEILAGRGRWLAAQSLGVPLCPCVRSTHLSDAQVRALIISDNKVAESEWDIPELKIEMGALKEFDELLLGLTAFSFEEIDKLLEGDLTADTSDKDADIPKVHFLTCGKHKIELTPEEHNDLVSLCSEWAGHHRSYKGLVDHILSSVRHFNGL